MYSLGTMNYATSFSKHSKKNTELYRTSSEESGYNRMQNIGGFSQKEEIL